MTFEVDGGHSALYRCCAYSCTKRYFPKDYALKTIGAYPSHYVYIAASAGKFTSSTLKLNPNTIKLVVLNVQCIKTVAAPPQASIVYAFTFQETNVLL